MKIKMLCIPKNTQHLARPRGVEPPACRLGGGRSILLSYGRIIAANCREVTSIVV